MRWVFGVLALLWSCGVARGATVGDEATLARIGPVEGTAFSHYRTRDALGRSIDFYLDDEGEDARPLALWIGGSGCESEVGSRGVGYGGILRRVLGARARVLFVEKPGVERGDRTATPGSALKCRPAFLVEHTFERGMEGMLKQVAAFYAEPATDGAR